MISKTIKYFYDEPEISENLFELVKNFLQKSSLHIILIMKQLNDIIEEI